MRKVLVKLVGLAFSIAIGAVAMSLGCPEWMARGVAIVMALIVIHE